MNSEQITQIIETIKTLNLNIDSQTAVEITKQIKPILWILVIEPYFRVVMIMIVFLGLGYMIYKLIKQGIKQDDNIKKEKEVNKFLEELNNWDSVKSIEEMLKEIIEYMPRNKKKRNKPNNQ